MRVTAIHRYFWPDTSPYASFLRQITTRWVEDGHDVEVISGQPTYASDSERAPSSEMLDGMRIRRIPVLRDRSGGWRQFANLVLFPLLVAWRILTSRRSDVIMCCTVPQVTLGWAVSAAARLRGSAFIYHCMDLHPEIGRISGEFRNPVVFRILARMDRTTMRRARRVVVLSEDMRQSVLERDPGIEDRIVVLNNWSLPDFDEPEPSPMAEPETGVLRVVFTGNIGRFQGLTTVVESLADLPDGVNIQLVFMGEGRAKSEVENTASKVSDRPDVDVVFLPQGSPSAAKGLMRTAHLGLVALVPEVVRYAYPSKTATYAVEGLPLLVLCEQDSELASTVRERGLGWSVAPGDTANLVAALTQAANELSSRGLVEERHAVKSFAEDLFTETTTLNYWSSVLVGVHEEAQTA